MHEIRIEDLNPDEHVAVVKLDSFASSFYMFGPANTKWERSLKRVHPNAISAAYYGGPSPEVYFHAFIGKRGGIRFVRLRKDSFSFRVNGASLSGAENVVKYFSTFSN